MKGKLIYRFSILCTPSRCNNVMAYWGHCLCQFLSVSSDRVAERDILLEETDRNVHNVALKFNSTKLLGK